MVLWNKQAVDFNKRRPKDYFTEYYYTAAQIYNRYKRFGLPFAGGWYDSGGMWHSGGWADHPEYIVRIIELFDSTVKQFEEHQSGS